MAGGNRMSGEWGDKKIDIDNPEVEKTIGKALAAGIVLGVLGWLMGRRKKSRNRKKS